MSMLAGKTSKAMSVQPQNSYIVMGARPESWRSMALLLQTNIKASKEIWIMIKYLLYFRLKKILASFTPMRLQLNWLNICISTNV